MGTIDVSVIIVNYNTDKELDDCIVSIHKYTSGVNYEIIVIDNDSKPEIKKRIKAKNYEAKIIYNPNNVGFGRANNIGTEIARGKYIFFLNSDTVLLNNAIKIFYDRMELESPSVACLGTYLKNKNYEVIHSYGKFPTISNSLYLFIIYPILRKFGFKYSIMDYKLPQKESIVEYITGADIFMRKNVGDQLGYFDPRYFLYYEETDMQKKYSVNGYVCKIIEGPEILHLCGASGSKVQYKKMKFPLQSHFIYLKKWNPYFLYLIYKFCYIMGRFLFLIFLPHKWKENVLYLKSAFIR